MWIQTFLASRCLSDWGSHYSQISLSSFLRAWQGPHSLKLLQARWEETCWVQQTRPNGHASTFQSPYNRARKALLVRRQAYDLALNSTFHISYGLWNIRKDIVFLEFVVPQFGELLGFFFNFLLWKILNIYKHRENRQWVPVLCLVPWKQPLKKQFGSGGFWGELWGGDSAGVKEAAGQGERWTVRHFQQQL